MTSKPDSLSSLPEEPHVQQLAVAAGQVPCHLVGGVIRDRRLGIDSVDLDAVVERSGEDVSRRLADELGLRLVLLGGDRFAAYRLVGPELRIDIWDRRGAALAADLQRRDFTVNSVAMELPDGRLIDPHGGLDDLDDRLLRATTPTAFERDPLRVLRLVRFVAGPWGFRVEPRTRELARLAGPGLGAVARERVREELRLVLTAADGAAAAELLADLDLLAALWDEPRGWPADRRAAAAAVGGLDRLVAHRAPQLPTPRQLLACRLAALLSGLSRAAAEEPDKLLGRLRARGRVSEQDAAATRRLLRWRRLPGSRAERRRFLNDHGADWWCAACLLASGSLPGDLEAAEGQIEKLHETALSDGPEVFDPPILVDGTEAQRVLGLGPGPDLGRRLAALRTAQIEGRVRSRDEALRFLRGYD